jgi:hypothetical protein
VPRVRHNVANGGHGPFGRIFDSTVHGLRANAVRDRQWSLVRRGRHASPLRDLRCRASHHLLAFERAVPALAMMHARAVEAPAPPIVEAPA